MYKARGFLRNILATLALTFIVSASFAQTPAPTLLVLAKSDNTVAIVDPASLQVLARIPAGPDPHEIIASSDGKLAFISNYGGLDGALNTISVVDLVARKALPPIDLGALRSTHGLAYAGGKLYFTAETNKVVGRYDPATQRVDWVLGTGQDRTHMIAVSKTLDQIVTSNVNSATISIIEQLSPRNGGFGPPPGSGPPAGRQLNLGGGAAGILIAPDGSRAYVAVSTADKIAVVDLGTLEVIGQIDAGKEPDGLAWAAWK